MATQDRRIHWIPGVFVASFGLVVAANAALIWFAIESFSGLDTAHPYESGLNYNATLAEAASVAKMGWKSELSAQKAENGLILEIRLHDKSNLPLSELSLRGRLVRPTNAALDHSLVFQEVSPGIYHSQPVVGLPAGLWEARIAEQAGKDGWQTTERLVLK